MHMRGSRWMLPLTLMVVAASCAQQEAKPTVDTAAIGASIDSLNQGFNAAVAARDTDAVVSIYSDDARVMPAHMPEAVGKDAIRRAWAGLLSFPGLELSITDNGRIIAEAGDQVVEHGAYRMKFQGPNGQPVEDVGKYVAVFKKVEGAWKIVVDTWNSDMPVPGA